MEASQHHELVSHPSCFLEDSGILCNIALFLLFNVLHSYVGKNQDAISLKHQEPLKFTI